MAISPPLRAEMLESGTYFADDMPPCGAGVAVCPFESIRITAACLKAAAWMG